MAARSGFRLERLLQSGELVLHRGRRDHGRTRVLVATPAFEPAGMAALGRLEHEYSLKDQLDRAWAVRPIELIEEAGRPMLVLEDPGGEPLALCLGAPMAMERFLRLAPAIAGALGRVHRRGLIHRDLKPAHILVDCADGGVQFTGFGIASQLPRERPGLQQPDTIAGSLAYMAPEQTGRMNRSVDSRSDLYALGVTFYEMLAGVLPLTASEPMEWVHRHIARLPEPLSARRQGTPGVVSALVMKLLAKTAEDRYQTAAGLEHDLRRCLSAWEAERQISDFPLGERDTPDRLLIPERLYGRERQIEQLLGVFDRVLQEGLTELALVSGYSGIGKSSLIGELHKALTPPRGLFAIGKFDQYKRNIPYATLAQALQSLVRSLLGESDAELAAWREAICEALGPNGRLIVDLIPELKLIVGVPPPAPEVPPQQEQSRFHLVFRRFIGVFARPEHPLVLVLDDLQWVDAATLDLLEDLLTQPDAGHLMLVGAYRDNEVGPAHLLTGKLEAMRALEARIEEIRLGPLTFRDLGQLVADALRCSPRRAAPLAGLVHEKTGGNAFFAIQFLRALAEEGLLRFDHDEGAWGWDLDRIHIKGYTDNIVDLMLGKLNRLPAKTKQALRQFACLGDRADTTELAAILGVSEAAAHAHLGPALRQELIVRQGRLYRFAHDRIQEAAYALIPEQLRAEAHLRIGRLLAASTPPERLEEAIFEIVNQLNRGVDLITDPAEREELAELDLIAGKRAKASTAYAASLAYLTAGAALLPQDRWERRRQLAFALEINRAECEFLTGDLTSADTRLTELAEHAADIVERADVACAHMDVYTTMNQSSRAVAVALGYLAQTDVNWSPHPTDEEVRREYEEVRRRLGGRDIEQLFESPLMTDRDFLATVEVLTQLHAPALFTDPNLAALAICKAVNLSLDRGHCDASCFAYVMLGAIAGPRFGDHQLGFRFGQLGYALVERRGLKRFHARTCLCFAIFVASWTRHVRTCRDLLTRAFDAANQIGDLQYAAYAKNNLNANMLFAGDPLSETQAAAERGLAFAHSARFSLAMDFEATQLAFIRTLRGATAQFGRLDDGQIEEHTIELRLAGDPALSIAECWYWIRKLQARFLAGDYEAAAMAASRAQLLLRTTASFLEEADYEFYSALAHAALCDQAQGGKRAEYLASVMGHHERLALWAKNCPENFEDRATLVAAEIERVEGRELNAERLYEQAIRAAAANGFVHNEALAWELAANFYAARGFEAIAKLYRCNVRHGYQRWGAEGKVRRLDELYPELRETEPISALSGSIDTSVERLDLATVLKLSQAISGEIVPERLIDTLLRTAIEHAGAERGTLVLTSGGEPRIAAAAVTSGDAVQVDLGEAPLTAEAVPLSIVNRVLRTCEAVILDDAAQSAFAADPYIQQRQARSVLCLPLVEQGALRGALYLENNVTPRAFAAGGVAALKLVASQAAIALEKSRLYRDLADREARIRRLVDANIIGIFIWELEGQLIEANDAFLQLVGYDRADLAAGLSWTDLTPSEWLDVDTAHLVPDLKRTGALQPFEKEYTRKDGRRVPVLIGVAMLEGSSNQGIAFVLDLTERKEAEERQKLLLDELNHRVKNTLATIQAISAQTFQTAESVEGFRTAFEGRLLALSRTHNIANRNFWQAAGLRELLTQVLEPFVDPRDPRCELIGDDVRLTPEMAVSIGLAFHELVTNACKYGALSAPTGRVRVSWRPEAESRLRLDWQELDGPRVEPPVRRGFGSRLLERALPRQICGAVDLDFRPEGVRCTMHIAVSRIDEPSDAGAPCKLVEAAEPSES